MRWDAEPISAEDRGMNDRAGRTEGAATQAGVVLPPANVAGPR